MVDRVTRNAVILRQPGSLEGRHPPGGHQEGPGTQQGDEEKQDAPESIHQGITLIYDTFIDWKFVARQTFVLVRQRLDVAYECPYFFIG